MKRVLKRLLLYIGILIVFFLAYLAYLHDDGNSISKGIPIPNYEQPTTALLIIDVQEGVTGSISTTQYYKDQAPELIKNVNQVITMAEEAGIPVIYIQQQTENWFLNWATGYVTAEGYPGVAIDSRLKMVSLHHYPKRVMDAFNSPGMEKLLQNLQVNRLFITGVDAAYCVNRTTQAALYRDYEVLIIEEAVISESEELKQENLEELKEKGAKVISLGQLAERLSE